MSNFEGERKAGKKERTLEIASRMLEEGLDVTLIAKITKLSEKEILQLQSENKK